MDLDKDVFTTFETAEICNANITSIKNWISRGELDAFKTPGGHHRIRRETLEDFLERHEMPNPFAARRQKRILLVHPDEEVVERLETESGSDHEYQITRDPVDALLILGQWNPGVAVIDCRIDELDVSELCERVRDHDELRPVELIVVCGGGDTETGQYREAGADYVVDRDDDEIVEAVTAAVEG